MTGDAIAVATPDGDVTLTAEAAAYVSATLLADRVAEQGRALAACADASPMALYSGMLAGMADELKLAAKALRECSGDGIDGAELTSAGALRAGCKLYWAGRGPGKVVRTANGYTGIFVEWDMDVPDWVNVLGPGTPVVVIP